MATDERDERGRFASGNCVALRHGGRSRQVQAGALEEQAEALLALNEARAQIVADLGGDGELSQMQRDLIASYLRIGLIEDYAYQSIERGGVFTAHGKQRAVVPTLMKAIAQRHDLAKTLGLQRRTKRIPEIAQWAVSKQNG